MLSSLPYGAYEQDTGEFMLGTVLATVVLMESDGSVDANLEDWNPLVRDGDGNVVLDENGRTISASGPNLIEQAKDKVREGMQWWEDTLANFGHWLESPTPTPVHGLDFIFDFEYAHNPVATGYEPISRPSYDYELWVDDFLDAVGYNTFDSLHVDIRSFNHAQRVAHEADWAFTIFVVNDENDPDGKFDYVGKGGFQWAFAFAGGQFFVAPAGRPPSSFAHETGHMFWARDEYKDGGSYTDHRGYYNTQNVNAWDNPDPDFVQQDSIMDSGSQKLAAYAAHISSESSLAMIGWQDSDADGVFDVLDVPLSLTGSGYWDPATGLYHFHGESAAQTLPNLNLSGLRNDITVNEVSLAEYSTDEGVTWTLAETYDEPVAEMDLEIELAAGQEVWIRTRSVDPITALNVTTSETVFHGSTDLPTSAVRSGIQGFAWEDVDGNGAWDAGEPGLPGWTLQLVDDQLQPLALQQTIEPDDYTQWQPLNEVGDGVTLSALGSGVANDEVRSKVADTASTGQSVFAYREPVTRTWQTEWNGASGLRIDFDTPVSEIRLDAIAPNAPGVGRLEIYDAADNLLGRYTTQPLEGDDVETMTLGHASSEIAYAFAEGTMGTGIRLDNLQIGPAAAAVTDSWGAYTLPHLPAGAYHVQAIPPSGWTVTTPASGVQDVVVQSDGRMQWDGSGLRPSDFAGQFDENEFPWQNPRDRFDVDDSGAVLPRDALLIINELNAHGAHALPAPTGEQSPPPFYDVNADNRVSPMDALLVINRLTSTPPGGGNDGAGGNGGGGGGEPEGESAFPLSPRTDLRRTTRPTAPTGRQAAPRPAEAPEPANAGWLERVTRELGRDSRFRVPPSGVGAHESRDDEQAAEWWRLWDDTLGLIAEDVAASHIWERGWVDRGGQRV